MTLLTLHFFHKDKSPDAVTLGLKLQQTHLGGEGGNVPSVRLLLVTLKHTTDLHWSSLAPC